MSDVTYSAPRHEPEGQAVGLAARLEAGYLLGLLQRGESIGMPHSRPMPTIGARCHELRIQDQQQSWRIVYRIDPDAIVLAEVFGKKTGKTPKATIELCQRRLKDYDREAKQASKTRK